MRAIEQIGRHGRALIILAVAVVGMSAAASAYWSAPSSGHASGAVGTLGAPTIEGATPGAGSVTLKWSAVAAPGGGVAYYVRRDGGAASSACPSAAAPATVLSCTDTGVSVGKHSYTVTAVWRSWATQGGSASAQVASGAATHFALTPATTTPLAGAADNLTIVAQDASDNTVTSYAGTKSLTFGGASSSGSFHPTVTSDSASATSFGTAEPIDFTGGIATASGGANGAMRLYRAETAHITVTDGTLSNGSGTSVTVSAAAAASFSLPTPAAQTAGKAFNETLTALDEYGNVATAYSGGKPIAFGGPASSPGGKAPSYPATVSFAAGEGTAAITLYNAAATTLTATQGSIGGSSGSFSVAPIAANSFAIGPIGAQSAGKPFEVALSARDEYGNVATSYAGVKSVSFGGPSTSPSGKAPSYPTTVEFSGGQGTASPVKLYDSQTTTLTATQGTLKATSASFTVAPGEASSFSVPTPTTQTAGSAFSVTLTAKDEYGNVATGYAGSMPLAFSGPAESPDGEAPSYPATVKFNAGVGSAQITLFDAQTTTLTAKEGAVSGTSGSFTVNGKSTTTQFGVSVPPGIVAGKEFNATLTAEDEFGNVTTAYTGSHSIAFSGPAKSPNNKSPVYDTSISFSSGKATATTTLYDAQTTALKASASSGTIVGESESFTVTAAAPNSFTAANPGAQVAGVPFTVTITGAKDAYGNAVTGPQPLAFGGPSNAPAGTAPTYPSSATFAAGEAKASVTLVDAQTTSLKVTSGSASSTTSSFAVSAGATSALSLAVATTTPIAGSADNLTITAVDSFGNTTPSYSGSKSLTFDGAKSGSGATVTNSAEKAVAFGEPTTISFSSGVAKVSGSGNGVMKLYAVETAHVTVSDGKFSNGTGLAVTVEGAAISSLALINGGFGGSSKGKIEAGDSFRVEFSDPIAVNTLCSAWSGNSSNHSFTGNNEVTVTLTDGGAGDDTLSVSSSKCTFHLGTIDLGSTGYISGANATFGGSGSNASTLKYTASSATLEVELGSKGGTGTVKQVSSSAATLTPDAGLTDEFGNTFPPFTTGTVAQF